MAGPNSVTNILYPATRLTSLGRSWTVQNSSGQTPASAIPGTTAMLVLWNGESSPALGVPPGIGSEDAGKQAAHYVIDSVGYTAIVAQSAIASRTLWYMINKGPVTAPTDDAAMTIRSLIGRAANYPDTAKKAQNQTVTNDGWFPIGTNPTLPSVAAGTIWTGLDWDARGLLIVPPGGMISLAVSSVDVTASSITCFFRWHELFLPNTPLR